ncbi:DUF4440 domain-containing protein [Pseudomonas qingdaonensis]|uniref:hypothetical protein n=1 Tax=Pseudomonas TaxID=286 RepID=UPI0009989881|nr:MULTISPECIES: hypothetical protein [Pseudomonas]MBG8558917.1 DUF4440 domain-containing protein [Pseudomonas qingdaonensis]MDD1953540.1 DUF4440 domain-containing protein [Pseudomonas sp. 8209]OOV98992.1 hypothetical protein MF6396_18315 [Pseudomonas sp. MF6396]
MPERNAGFEEVLEAHVQIRQWLAGEARPPLLERFAEGFSMFTLKGTVLDKAQLESFFAQAYGSRPGLRIEIDEMHDVAPGVVTYREHQQDDSGQTTLRWSTVVFDGQGKWLHLQETAVTPQPV